MKLLKLKTLKFLASLTAILCIVIFVPACTDPDEDPMEDNTPLVSSFDIPSDVLYPGTSIKFTNNSTGADSYDWNFGDGASSDVKTPSHTYSKSGTFTVTLKAINGTEETSSSKSIVVKEIENTSELSALFDMTNGPYFNKKDINFTNNSTDATSYFWDFGDGMTSTETSPIHQFSTEGDYVIKLTAYDADGKTDESSKPITVDKNPDLLVASFLDSGAPYYYQQDLIFNSQSGGISQVWDFGDGTTATTRLAIHKYTNPGSYTVKLTVSDGVNTKFITKSIDVKVKYVNTKITLSGVAEAHNGGDDDGVFGAIDFAVIELSEDGVEGKHIRNRDGLWNVGVNGRVKAGRYPANNSIIGNLNFPITLSLDEYLLRENRYRIVYGVKMSTIHRDNPIASWGTISMSGWKYGKKDIGLYNETIKCELFETTSDAGRIHYFRPQLTVKF